MPRASKTDTEIASMYAKYLHGLLKQGGMRALTDQETGEIEIIDFSAAILNAINNHLKRMNVSAMAGGAGSLAEEADKRLKLNGRPIGGKMPPIDLDGVDAATG